MAKNYSRILVISDLHIPYNHTDSLAFLTAIKNLLKPDKVVCIGDEVDFHAISFHNSDPDLFSPGAELELAKEKLKPLYKIFPEMDIIDSNHGSLVYRKQKHAGLPRYVFKSYNEILDAPKGWKWHHDLVLKMNDGRDVYFHHGKTANVTQLSKNMGMCAVQGHYHSKFKVEYWANPRGLYWGFQVGCLIDNKSMAFEYNKTTVDRPIIGCGIILDGHPKLLPMVLDKKGRWTKEIV